MGAPAYWMSDADQKDFNGDIARAYPQDVLDFNYAWPASVTASPDRGAFLPAPGRFPQGKGPFGHMNLSGGVENFTAEGGIMQYSFQEAGKERYGIKYGTKRTWGLSTKHWAVGARCARAM